MPGGDGLVGGQLFGDGIEQVPAVDELPDSFRLMDGERRRQGLLAVPT